MDEKRYERIQKVAQKLYDLIDPWDCDYATVDDFVIDIGDDPLSVIEYLADRLEEAFE